MYRLAALVVVVFLPAVALGQQAGGYSAGPTEAPAYEPAAGSPSPEWTQDRTFPGTRFWKLDPGRIEIEQWYRTRVPRDSGQPTEHLFQTELEFGLTPRIQLDVYENVHIVDGQLQHEGNQIEARIAVDPVYGRTLFNPVIYLEWHPRHLAADRGEARLLLGGGLSDRFMAAVNLIYEQNITAGPDGMGGSAFVPNPEMGGTGALSYAVLGQTLRAGAEVRFMVEKEAWDDARWEKALLVGPNLSARLAGNRLKAYATVFFGVTNDARKVDSLVILASAF